jgi:hypothetical protein
MRKDASKMAESVAQATKRKKPLFCQHEMMASFECTYNQMDGSFSY